jgi:hypothetical protein
MHAALQGFTLELGVTPDDFIFTVRVKLDYILH